MSVFLALLILSLHYYDGFNWLETLTGRLIKTGPRMPPPEEIKWKEGDWPLFEAQLTASPFSSRIQNNKASSVFSFRTNIKLSLECVTAAGSKPASPWPKASSAVILRGTSPSGPYKIVKSIDGSASLPSLKPEVRGKALNGEKQSRQRYEMEFSDEDIKTDGHYFYKLRFLDDRKKPIYESGFCSVLVLHPPTVETAIENVADSPAGGYQCLSWKTPDLKTSAFIRPPKIVVRHSRLGELARFPMGKGSFRSPFKTNRHDFREISFDVGMEVIAKKDFWTMTGGQGQKIATERYLADLHFTPGQTGGPALPAPSAKDTTAQDSKNQDALNERKKKDGRQIQRGLKDEKMDSRPKRVETVSYGFYRKPGEHYEIIVRTPGELFLSPKHLENLEGSGISIVSWIMPESLKLKKVSVKSSQFNEKTFGVDDNSFAFSQLLENGYPLKPGLSENCSLTYTWAEEKYQITSWQASVSNNRFISETTSIQRVPMGESEEVSATVNVVRAPLPGGLRADAGDKFIRLSWDPLAWNGADWIEKPYFVLRRYEQSGVKTGEERLEFSSFREFVAGEADATEFTDREVVNGQACFYELEVRGVTRATSWQQDLGKIPCNIPVCSGSKSIYGKNIVNATPGKRGPARIALFTSEENSPGANAVQMRLIHEINRIPWLKLVERSSIAPLLDERTVKKLQDGAEQKLMSADIVLQIKDRKSGYLTYVDVWMEDFHNAYRERLMSIPLDQTGFGTCAKEAIRKISARFPEWGKRTAEKRNSNSRAGKNTGVIIVAGFRPFTSESLRQLPAGANFDILLMSALSGQQKLKIVDRDKIADLLAELGRSGSSDTPDLMKLGKILHADTLLTGCYGVDGDRLVVMVHLVDVNNSEIFRTIELDGSISKLDEMAIRLTSLISVNDIELSSDATPLMRWLEAQAYNTAAPGLNRSLVQTFISPDISNHLEKGRQYKARGEYQKALDSFREGMDLAERDDKADPWRLYVAAEETLRQSGHRQDEVDLWKRAAANREHRGHDADEAYLKLALCLLNLNNNAEAAAALDKMKSASYERGRAYELAGLPSQAAETYLHCIQLPASYAALIRILDTLNGEKRNELLKLLLEHIGDERPRQIIKIASELEKVGLASMEILQKAASTAEAVGDSDDADRFLSFMIRSSPESLLKMRTCMKLASLKKKKGDTPGGFNLMDQALNVGIQGEEAESLRGKIKIQITSWKNPEKNSLNGNPFEYSPRRRFNDFKISNETFRVYDNGVLARMDSVNGKTSWEHVLPSSVSDLCLRVFEIIPNTPIPGNSVCFISPGKTYAGALTLDGDLIFISLIHGGILQALDQKSGKLRWTYTDWSWISPALPDKEKIYLGNSLGDLSVISKNDGQLLYRITHTPEIENNTVDPLERIPVISQDRAAGLIRFEKAVPGSRTSYSYPSHTVSLADKRVALLETPSQKRETTRPARLSSTEAMSPLDKAVSEAVDDIIKNETFHKPLDDERKTAIKEVSELFSKCLQKDPSALDELKEILESASFGGLLAVGLVARLMPEEQFVPCLSKNFDPKNFNEIKYVYSKALSAIGDPKAIPALFVWLSDEIPDDREGTGRNVPVNVAPALEALEALSGQALGPERSRWEIWWANEKQKLHK